MSHQLKVCPEESYLTGLRYVLLGQLVDGSHCCEDGLQLFSKTQGIQLMESIINVN